MFPKLNLGILWIAFCALQGPATAKDEVCVTEQCNKTAEQIKHQMGSSAPCANFHEYVCGNWKGSKETKETVLKKKALSDLIVLLENAVITRAEKFNAADKLIAAYRSCTKQAKNKTALQTSAKRVLEGYELGEWPVLNSDCENNGKDYQEILKKTGPRPLFRYFISGNDSNPIILMTKPRDFEVSGVDYADYSASQKSGNEGGEKVAQDYDYSSIADSSEKTYKEFIEKSILLLTNVSREQAAEKAEEIVLFEKNLSKIAYEAGRLTEMMTLSQMSARLGDEFPMDEVLQKDFKVVNITIRSTTHVEVEYIGYYTKVMEFLRNLTSTAGLKNYIMWVTVREMAKAEETDLHDLYLQYKNKTSIFDADIEERSNDTKLLCLLQLLQHDIMYSAAANFYSQSKFDRESRNDVLKILGFINSTFMQVINNNTWMSNYTKTEAIKRVTSIVPVIGYPGWIINDTVVNSLYQFVPDIKPYSSFVESFHWLQENEHFQKLLKLTSSYFNKKHEDVTLRSHAYYVETTDTMVYPAASLVTHYRKTGIPRSLNFGTIGTIFAQLFTNAIDRFDDVHRGGKRTKVDFWDNSTAEQFCKRSTCLNNSKECYDKEHCYSSSYEQLHDYLGVRVSHIALQQSKKNYTNPFLLPGQEFDTEDKIFFTTFGSLYCPYSVNEKKVQSRADLPEEKYPDSLNEIVSQYEHFKTAFKCNGSVKDTCDLMPPMITSGSKVC